MHILLLIVGALVGAAFWYYRLKYISKAGAEVADAFGKARGTYRRKKLRQKADESPIAAIDDPIIGAATLLVLLVSGHSPPTPRDEDAIRKQINRIAEPAVTDEAIVYGRWVRVQGLDSAKAITMLCEKLNTWLQEEEKTELAYMIGVLQENNDVLLSKLRVEQAIRRLRIA